MHRTIFDTSLRKFPSYSVFCNRYDMTDLDMNAEKRSFFISLCQICSGICRD